MNKEEAEKIIQETIEYANDEIKKGKNKYLKILLITLSVLLLVIILYIFLFKYEFQVKYSENLVDVNVMEDSGLGINVNLPNYENIYALLVQFDENSYDLYINVTQTVITKLLRDNDSANNYLRVGNGIVVDFKSGTLREFLPNGNQTDSIMHIYYVNSSYNDFLSATDNELINCTDKFLVWERN